MKPAYQNFFEMIELFPKAPPTAGAELRSKQWYMTQFGCGPMKTFFHHGGGVCRNSVRFFQDWLMIAR